MKLTLKRIISTILILSTMLSVVLMNTSSVSAKETVEGSFDFLSNYIEKNKEQVLEQFEGIILAEDTDLKPYSTVCTILYKDAETSNILLFSTYISLIPNITTGCIMNISKEDSSYSVYMADLRGNNEYIAQGTVNPSTFNGTVDFDIYLNENPTQSTEKQKLFNDVLKYSLDYWNDFLLKNASISLANFGFANLGYSPMSLTGLIKIGSEINYYTNGKLDTKFEGLTKYNSLWYYVKDGKIDYSYTGMVKKQDGWWYVQNGTIDFNYTGMAKNQYGWWYLQNGTIDFNYTGMAKNQYGWWYITNGKLDTKYTGMAKNQYGWWYLTNGKIDYSFVGLAKNQYGWWYITNGTINYKFKGLVKNQYGWWYVQNGTINFKYNGYASNQYGTWRVVNGKVVK